MNAKQRQLRHADYVEHIGYVSGINKALDDLRREAPLGSRTDFDRFMGAVPDAAPDAKDTLPSVN
ncbi:MAG: hypothetical protein IPN06_06360 [Burkholderiales bacterium]|nr:hypothetical protein [Burkholderiales bacterium]